jgi:hypothetical protein
MAFGFDFPRKNFFAELKAFNNYLRRCRCGWLKDYTCRYAIVCNDLRDGFTGRGAYCQTGVCLFTRLVKKK